MSVLHVNCARPCTPYTSPITSAHCTLSFVTLAAVRSTTLRSRLFNRYGRRCHFSWRQPGRRQRLKPYAYSYRTQEAPGRRQQLGPYAYRYRTQLKPHRGKKYWQPNDFGIFLSVLLLHVIHVPFHIHHQLTVSIFTLFMYPFFVITHLSNS